MGIAPENNLNCKDLPFHAKSIASLLNTSQMFHQDEQRERRTGIFEYDFVA